MAGIAFFAENCGSRAARTLALMPMAGGGTLTVEIGAGCENFIGRFARLAEFRHDRGLIRFREAVG